MANITDLKINGKKITSLTIGGKKITSLAIGENTFTFNKNIYVFGNKPYKTTSYGLAFLNGNNFKRLNFDQKDVPFRIANFNNKMYGLFSSVTNDDGGGSTQYKTEISMYTSIIRNIKSSIADVKGLIVDFTVWKNNLYLLTNENKIGSSEQVIYLYSFNGDSTNLLWETSDYALKFGSNSLCSNDDGMYFAIGDPSGNVGVRKYDGKKITDILTWNGGGQIEDITVGQKAMLASSGNVLYLFTNGQLWKGVNEKFNQVVQISDWRSTNNEGFMATLNNSVYIGRVTGNDTIFKVSNTNVDVLSDEVGGWSYWNDGKKLFILTSNYSYIYILNSDETLEKIQIDRRDEYYIQGE